jgi:hypothetical protein
VTVSDAARRDLARLPENLRESALAAAVLDLARRLDDDPGDRDAAGVARELRIALATLRGWGAETAEDTLDVGNASMGH